MAVSAGTFIAGENPLTDQLTLFLLQVVIIVSLSRFLAYILDFIRQPRVIAEVIGGILLGPSALSRWPAFKDTVFPEVWSSSASVLFQDVTHQEPNDAFGFDTFLRNLFPSST